MTNTLSQPLLEAANVTEHFKLAAIINTRERTAWQGLKQICSSSLCKYLSRNEQHRLNIIIYKVGIFNTWSCCHNIIPRFNTHTYKTFSVYSKVIFFF